MILVVSRLDSGRAMLEDPPHFMVPVVLVADRAA